MFHVLLSDSVPPTLCHKAFHCVPTSHQPTVPPSTQVWSLYAMADFPSGFVPCTPGQVGCPQLSALAAQRPVLAPPTTERLGLTRAGGP